MPIQSTISLNPQINAVSLTGAASVVAQIALPEAAGCTVQTKAVCTAGTGTWKFEVSNDGVDWNDVTSSFGVVNNPSGLTGTSLNFLQLPANVASFNLLQITFTNSAGTCVVTVSVRGGSLPT